ncbi:phosphotransferase family protein [Sphingobium sp. AN558]|uniref:phosphotransferase family protein n=1 Tax=Sphingobium sp. AN558 TaxID=3133442 RepID=UPI0030BA9F08
MNLDTRRLIDALAKSLDRMASRFDIPLSDMDHMAAATITGELLRREDPVKIAHFYATGHVLAQRLAEVVDADADEAGQLRCLPSSGKDYAAAQAGLVALKKSLSSLVARSGYPADPTGALQPVIAELCVWECDLLKLPSPAEAPASGGSDFRRRLEESAQAQGGAFENAEIVAFTPLIGGFSNETTLFTLAGASGERWDLVSRLSTGLPLGIEGRDIDGEYFLLRYLHRHGAAVAEPLWLERDVEKYGAQFLVTRKLEGSNFGTVVSAERLSPARLRALAIQLASIHSLPLDAADADLQQSLIDADLVGVSTRDAVSAYLDRWIKLWRSTGLASPTVEATLHWLRANLPQNDEPPVLVHGDYALHNIMMQGDQISGVLDWELSHLGDRAEDLMGLLASLSSEEEAEIFMRHYIDAGGKAPTQFQLEYCNVFRFFIMYTVMQESEFRFYSLPGVHPELLVLGSFVQTPAARMAQAIEKAEAAQLRA